MLINSPLARSLAVLVVDSGGSCKKLVRTILIAASLVSSGCAVINPYESDFSCPDTYHGKCISVQGAYEETISGKDDAYIRDINTCIGGNCPEQGGKGPAPEKSGTIEDRNYNAYRSSLYNRYDQLLREPQTPVVAPPKVMRILMLPYKGESGEFYMYRYAYFFTEEPKWILGDSVEAFEE